MTLRGSCLLWRHGGCRTNPTDTSPRTIPLSHSSFSVFHSVGHLPIAAVPYCTTLPFPIYTLAFLKTRSSIDIFLALYDYSSDCSFLSFISSLLNFSGYCIITLMVSIILCQYQFALFDINYLSRLWTLCIVWTLCFVVFIFTFVFISLNECLRAVRLSLLFLLKATGLDLTWITGEMFRRTFREGSYLDGN